MATDVETLIIAVKTKDFAKAQKELNKLKKAAKEAEGATEGLKNETEKSTSPFRKLRGSTSALTNTTGQLSVQIQDVGVQLQQGTDAVRIFAQQGPQIASIFGPTGAVFGALIAFTALIGGPFIKSLFAGNEAIKETTKRIKELKEGFDELTAAQRQLKIDQLREEQKELEDQISKLTKQLESETLAMNAMRKEQSMSNDVMLIGTQIFTENTSVTEKNRQEKTQITASLDDLNQKLRENKRILGEVTGVTKEDTEETKRNKKAIEAALQSGREQVQVLGLSKIAAELFRFELQGAREDQIEARKVQLEAIAADEARTKALEDQARATKQARDALASFIEKEEQRSQQKDMSITMRLLATATDLATKAGKELTAEEFNRIVVAGQRLQQIEDEKQLIKDANELDKITKKQQIERERALAKEQARNQARIRAEEEGREKEAAESRKRIREAEDEARRLGLIDVEQSEIASFARRLEEQKRHARNIDLSEKQRAEAQKNIEREKNNFLIKNTGDALDSLGQINQKAFKAAKAYNIGVALMNTYTGASEALKLPFPFNIVAAAAVVAAGLAQVQQIKSQSFAGRALGGQVRGGESYVVGERGPEILTMGASGRVIPNEKITSAQQVVNKTANVTFQISTVDARGFDQLLQSRRGQIVSIVKQAKNDRGARGVV